MLFDPKFRSQFQDIRCYDDKEVCLAIADPEFQSAISNLLGSLFQIDGVAMSRLFRAKTLDDVTTWIVQELVSIAETTTSGLQISGLDNLRKDQAYVFVSNHHDIAMDPILINLALTRNGFPTCHNAIGDNLLQNHLSQEVAKLNKCFRVNRTTRSPKAMLLSLKHQSEYIQYLNRELKQNVWIAQQEGRSKNRNDVTNPALIKMLSLSTAPTQRVELLSSLNIVPVCITYEWDPCDQDKVARLIAPDNSLSAKNAADYMDVLKGLTQPKGNVSIAFGAPIDVHSTRTEKPSPNPATVFDDYAQTIDAFIRRNYATFPNTTAAKALLAQFGKPVQVQKVQKLTAEQSDAVLILKQRFGIVDGEDLTAQAIQLLKNYAYPLLA